MLGGACIEESIPVPRSAGEPRLSALARLSLPAAATLVLLPASARTGIAPGDCLLREVVLVVYAELFSNTRVPREVGPEAHGGRGRVFRDSGIDGREPGLLLFQEVFEPLVAPDLGDRPIAKEA